VDKIEINEEGVSELVEKGRELLAEKARQVADEATSMAPVKTGRLASSISANGSGDGWVVRADAPYAAFVELGTRYQAAQPFLRPAIQSVQSVQSVG